MLEHLQTCVQIIEEEQVDKNHKFVILSLQDVYVIHRGIITTTLAVH